MPRATLTTVPSDGARGDHPYSLVRTRDGVLGWVAGVLPYDEHGRVVTARDAAIDAAIDGLAARVARAGASLADVVSVTVYLTDLAWRDALNTRWMARFPEPWPARTAVEVARLPRDAPIELHAVVHCAAER